MLKTMKSIESAFQFVRLFSIILSLAAVFLACFAIQQGYRYAKEGSNTIYVLAGGQVFKASAGDMAENTPVEIKDHVKVFHKYFFTLEANMKAIEDNINNALLLADESARSQYLDLREKGYYAGIVTGNVTQTIKMDSVVVKHDDDHFSFRYYGKITIIRPTVKVERSIVTEGNIRQLEERTDDNSHALKIERWRVVENNDIKTENR